MTHTTPATAPETEPRYTHFVPAGPAAVDEALSQGLPITAACGRVWVPSRDPDMFPRCPRCEQALTWWRAA